MADTLKRFRYWEGLVDGCIPHAWLTINRKLVDVTAEAVSRQLERNGKPGFDRYQNYAGVMVNRSAIWRHTLKTGMFGPVLEIE